MNTESTRGYLSFSVDDCYADTLALLHDIAKREQFLFSCAVPTAYVDKILDGSVVASWQLLEELSAQGHEIGSHSVSHAIPERFFSTLLRSIRSFFRNKRKRAFVLSRLRYCIPHAASRARISLAQEVVDSKKSIEEHVGAPCYSFTMPGGVYNPEVVRLAKRAGYRFVRTSDDGINTVESFSPYALKVKIWNKHTRAQEANEWVLEAEKRGAWLIELVHGIVEHSVSLYDASREEFEAHVSFIKSRKMHIGTIASVGSVMREKRRDYEHTFFEQDAPGRIYFIGGQPRLLSSALHALPSPAKVLDIGSADGAIISSIRAVQGKGEISVLATDISLARCRSMAQLIGVPALWADSRHLPIKDQSFDLMVDDEIIAFVEDDFDFLLEHNRVLKKGGLLLLSALIRTKWGIYCYRSSAGFVLDPMQTTIYSHAQELYGLLHETGFEIVEEKKRRVTYALLDMVFRFLHMMGIKYFNDPLMYQRHPFLERLRRLIVIPIPGFWDIEILAKKCSHRSPNRQKNDISSRESIVYPSYKNSSLTIKEFEDILSY